METKMFSFTDTRCYEQSSRLVYRSWLSPGRRYEICSSRLNNCHKVALGQCSLLLAPGWSHRDYAYPQTRYSYPIHSLPCGKIMCKDSRITLLTLLDCPGDEEIGWTTFMTLLSETREEKTFKIFFQFPLNTFLFISWRNIEAGGRQNTKE